MFIMTMLREKLKKLKETHPVFKDYDFKTYHNDLTVCGILIDKILEEKRIEELKNNKNNK